MRFSKLKKSIEQFICNSLKGHIELHAAVYRHSHDDQARVWITFDKKQILSAADLSFSTTHFYLEEEIKERQQLKPIPYNNDWQKMLESPERKALIEASNTAEQYLIEEGVLASWHIYHALLTYPNLSINDALSSEDPFIRAFVLFDKRVGKRRLLKLSNLKHPLEIQFYKIRCEAEGEFY